MINATYQEEKEFVISYLTLRKTIGWMGVLLPFVLVIGNWLHTKFLVTIPGLWSPVSGNQLIPQCEVVRHSISDFYYTPMNVVFTGIISSYAFFLYCYRGHDSRDNRMSNWAALFALGIILFPTSPDAQDCSYHLMVSGRFIGILHLVCAGMFFYTLARISWFQFTQYKHELTALKLKRIRIYKASAVVIISCMLLILLNAILESVVGEDWAVVEQFRPVLVLETIMLLAFGVSWLVKGEQFLKKVS